MLYNIILSILNFFSCIYTFFGGKKGEFLKKRLKQNYNALKKEDYIWLHCSSVGEINLSETFIKKILEKKKERILLTLFTDTGYALAKEKFKNYDKIDIFYFPLDNKKELNKILEKINLKLLIVMETEIWYNLINLAKKQNSKIIFVNGRISDRSFNKYKAFKFYLKNLFKKVDKFYMQSDIDKKRIIELGANENKVVKSGNLKFDVNFQEYNEMEKTELLENFCVDNREIFVAGSSRSGEYEILLDTFSRLKNTLFIIVPRHMDKLDIIENMIKEYGFSSKRFSQILQNKNKKEKVDIIIVDMIGILRKIYSVADFVFVGGTLVNIGGHSLLEPLYYKKMVLFGKYLSNVKDISQEILKRELGYKVENSADFLKGIEKIRTRQPLVKEDISKLFLENKNIGDFILNDIEKNIFERRS